MAIAMKNPPIRRNIILFPYSAVTSPTSRAPIKGKRIIGRSEVAGMGIASVNHQHAIHAVLAAIDLASQGIPSMSERRMNKKSTGPSTRPAFRLDIIGSLVNESFLLRSHYQNRSICPSYYCTGCTSYQ